LGRLSVLPLGSSHGRTGYFFSWAQRELFAEYWAEVHVFGHSHIPWDETMDGVRYLQHPLAYPQERRGREHILAQIV
jgi:hypothetical protein